MQRIYNQFHAGVQQDDFLTNGAGFIEQKNIDGLRDGYGVTLGPKVNKLLLTSEPMRGMSFFQSIIPDLNRSIIGGDDGKIYRGDSTDNTPEYTLTNGGHIIAIQELSGSYFIFYKLDKDDVDIDVAKINRASAWSDTWGDIDEIFKVGEFSHVGTPPITVLGNFMYIGDASTVKRMDVSGSIVPYGFPDSDVVGITIQGYTFVVYCEDGNIFLWDGATSTNTTLKQLGSRISKVTTKGGIDYISTENGQFWIGQGLSFQRITKTKWSNRMNDNTSFDKRLDFSIDEPQGLQNHSMLAADDDVYMYASDTVKGLYKYGSLIPGMQSGLHKVITQNHLGAQIDYIYDMFFYERTARRLYFSYKADTTYGVDYIELDSLETCTDGYMITEVFSGGTSFLKKLSRLRRATSNTAGSNYIKVYYKVNNGDWVLIRNINDTLDVIERENAHREADESSFKQFVDVQLKIELHNDDGGENAPTLHELMLEYEAIET